ncbi:hypothetical protein ABT56_19010 [Photobacterium aquae]|uniref:SprT-like domain-containing protein n=1 Tax=Photobacterium aquae TaxID=1195763 RepID=A0A0J1GVQ1_9GAMM|nr:SprT-like domain-containing protein [Photobacterium aquae]KLV03524.1 hypothetical protein ABT56_19010 [Photobacterium aquae]
MLAPTTDTYENLLFIYNYFNKNLFDEKLPHCLITLQRQPNSSGYLCTNRFINNKGETVAELAVNPECIPLVPLISTLSVIVHEQVHLWQHHFGKPSRNGYHNKEWAAKMQEIGLMPSHDGNVGGKRTGQNMSDYPIIGGKFMSLSEKLVELRPHLIKWYDMTAMQSETIANNDMITKQDTPNLQTIPYQSKDSTKSTNKKNTRSKFVCQKCGDALWGKSSLKVLCINCNTQYEIIG